MQFSFPSYSTQDKSSNIEDFRVLMVSVPQRPICVCYTVMKGTERVRLCLGICLRQFFNLVDKLQHQTQTLNVILCTVQERGICCLWSIMRHLWLLMCFKNKTNFCSTEPQKLNFTNQIRLYCKNTSKDICL